MKTAFFGGSFNPPHVGHVLAASYVLSVGFDQVFVAVVKDHAHSKALAPFRHRLRMTELAFQDTPSIIVSDLEERLASPSFTLQTLTELHRLHPDWELHLVAGSDVISELPSWHQPEQVLALAPLFALGRLGHPLPQAPPSVLPEVSSSDARRRVAAKDDEWLQRYVPRTVLDYISSHALYT